MSQVLSKNEVDALLNGIESGDVNTENEETESDEVKPFDFSNQERVSYGGSLPALHQVHDRFTRQFKSTLANAVKRSVSLNLAAQSRIKFSEFIKTIPYPSSLHVFKIDPLKGLAVCVIEGGLVYTLINNFFGGKTQEKGELEAREFTPIEQRIIKMVIDMVLQDYTHAWQSIDPFKIQHVGSEMNPQFVNVVPGNETVICVEVEIELEDTIGKLKFCLPDSLLEPIRDQLKNNFQDKGDEPKDDMWLRMLNEQVEEVGVRLKVDLGSAEITGRDLLELKTGDIISLNKESNAPIKVYVEEIPKYIGYLGTYHGSHAVKIDQLIEK